MILWFFFEPCCVLFFKPRCVLFQTLLVGPVTAFHCSLPCWFFEPVHACASPFARQMRNLNFKAKAVQHTNQSIFFCAQPRSRDLATNSSRPPTLPIAECGMLYRFLMLACDLFIIPLKSSGPCLPDMLPPASSLPVWLLNL